eukprot:gnl/MRDRNA2_/MRDRNA2_68626_c0_seq1.p1 gnl/MRDRNA2_/MRDRNA2_68626_c0~~gnl/MRDRNA2_/MRDRNA2_68626_c0_seq1.p1  ORF type:complete len:115 (-),score=16.12 gnl/MRDRNA2_/MRDRNA2_68626_c0_seq1:51-395(-)
MDHPAGNTNCGNAGLRDLLPPALTSDPFGARSSSALLQQRSNCGSLSSPSLLETCFPAKCTSTLRSTALLRRSSNAGATSHERWPSPARLFHLLSPLSSQLQRTPKIQPYTMPG